MQYTQALVSSLIQSLGARFITKALDTQIRENFKQKYDSILKLLYENAISDEIIFSKLMSLLKNDRDVTSAFRLGGCSDTNFKSVGSKKSFENQVKTASDQSIKVRLLQLNGDESPVLRNYSKPTSAKANCLYCKGGSRESYRDVDMDLFSVSSYSLKSEAMLDSELGSLTIRRIPTREDGFITTNNSMHRRALSTKAKMCSIHEEAISPRSKGLRSPNYKRPKQRDLENLGIKAQFESPNIFSQNNSNKGSPYAKKHHHRHYTASSEAIRNLKFTDHEGKAYE